GAAGPLQPQRDRLHLPPRDISASRTHAHRQFAADRHMSLATRHYLEPFALTQNAPSPHDGLPYPKRTWAIVTVGLAIFMTVVDQTIVNVALPTMSADLQVDPSSSVWIVNAYQVAIMLTLLPLSSAGDIIGYKRVYIWGLALFTAASLGCALSPSLLVLTLMRVIQGFGAAGV